MWYSILLMMVLGLLTRYFDQTQALSSKSTYRMSSTGFFSTKLNTVNRIIMYASGMDEDDDDERSISGSNEKDKKKGGGVFKIAKKTEYDNFVSPNQYTEPSPLINNIIIVGGTSFILLASVLFFLYINKDIPAFENNDKTFLLGTFLF